MMRQPADKREGSDPYVVIKLRRGRRALVSAEDAKRVAAHTWGVSTVTRKDGTQHGYANSMINGCFTGMHRFVLGMTKEDKLHVDHINGDSLDNRRENLRLASRSNNLKNLRADLRRVSSTRPQGSTAGQEPVFLEIYEGSDTALQDVSPASVYEPVLLRPREIKAVKPAKVRPFLSNTEKAVALLHIPGFGNGEIAKLRNRSVKTISTLKTRVAKKLGFTESPTDVRLAIAIALFIQSHPNEMGVA